MSAFIDAAPVGVERHRDAGARLHGRVGNGELDHPLSTDELHGPPPGGPGTDGLGVSQVLWRLMVFNLVYALLLAAFVRESPQPSE